MLSLLQNRLSTNYFYTRGAQKGDIPISSLCFLSKSILENIRSKERVKKMTEKMSAVYKRLPDSDQVVVLNLMRLMFTEIGNSNNLDAIPQQSANELETHKNHALIYQNEIYLVQGARQAAIEAPGKMLEKAAVMIPFIGLLAGFIPHVVVYSIVVSVGIVLLGFPLVITRQAKNNFSAFHKKIKQLSYRRIIEEILQEIYGPECMWLFEDSTDTYGRGNAAFKDINTLVCLISGFLITTAILLLVLAIKFHIGA